MLTDVKNESSIVVSYLIMNIIYNNATNNENCEFTGSFRQFVNEESGHAEMNLTEVSAAVKKKKISILLSYFSVCLTLLVTLLVALPDHVWLKRTVC